MAEALQSSFNIRLSNYYGNITVIDEESNALTLLLSDFIGELSIEDPSIVYLKILLHGNSEITSGNIILSKQASTSAYYKLDSIQVYGSGSCKFNELEATSVTIKSNCTIEYIKCNVTRFENCTVKATKLEEYQKPFIEASGHIWFVDSVVLCRRSNDTSSANCIISPYLLIDNSNCKFRSTSKVLVNRVDNTSLIPSIQHCIDTVITENRFFTTGRILDNNEIPKAFTYVDKSAWGVPQADEVFLDLVSREKLYGHEPATKIYPFDLNLYGIDENRITDDELYHIFNVDSDTYESELLPITQSDLTKIFDVTYRYDNHHHDNPMKLNYVKDVFDCNYQTYPSDYGLASYGVFKESTYYTNVDLHRWINQTGAILPHADENSIYIPVIDTILKKLWQDQVDDDPERIDEAILDAISSTLSEYEIDNDLAITSEDLFRIVHDIYYPLKRTNYLQQEMESRNYEVGIYSLNSYRTTKRIYTTHGEEVISRPDLDNSEDTIEYVRPIYEYSDPQELP